MKIPEDAGGQAGDEVGEEKGERLEREMEVWLGREQAERSGPR